MITALTNDNYPQEVLKSDKPVLIDFWAEWCGPCRMMSEVVEDIAESRSDIKVCKVNVDDERDMAVKFGIDAIPTIILIRNGSTAAESVGYMQKDELLSKLGL